ncbi:MAG: hypothetical protein MJ151_03065, partial [Lachnospiraceae bacterium]|nr:hypothetical protein [Lachnospiraceae bacterium]
MQNGGFKKKKIKILEFFTKTRLLIVLFIVLFIGFNVYQFMDLQPKRTYYTVQNEASFPIIYQNRKGKKINELRGYRDEKYKSIMNDTLTVLNDNRELSLIINKNNNDIKEMQYEIRNKTTNELLERTVLYIPETKEEEIEVTARIQNLIEEKTTYEMIFKFDIGDKSIYYFSNIIYKRKNVLDEALSMIEDFTDSTFDEKRASKMVKYLETNPNVDQKQLFNVTIESNFEQLTWGGTKMKKESEYYYDVFQAQDYCYNVNVYYLASCKNDNNENEYYSVKDEYVLRWDEKRFYIMKFDRSTEEYINLDNDIFDKEKKRFSLGVTDIDLFEKMESDNKKYAVFNKNKEIYLYDDENHSIQNIYGYHIHDKDSYMRNMVDVNTKLLDIEDNGNVKFLVYGYNRNGANEGLVGISVYSYDKELSDV